MGGVWLAKHRHKQHFEDEFVLTARHEVPCDWFRRKSFRLQLVFQEQFGADKQDLAGIVLRVRVLPCTLKRLETY